MSRPPSVAVLWETTSSVAAPHGADLNEADLVVALGRFLERLGQGGAGLTVLLADDARLRELNGAWRGLDRPTDVLSWSYLDAPQPGGEAEAPALLGELAVSLERAAVQAAENGWPLRTEVLRLLAHGCAHLVGYDHETLEQEREMKPVEVALLADVGLTGLYPED